MDVSEAKEQLVEAELRSIPRHDLHFDPPRRKRSKRSTLLPSIGPQQQRHPRSLSSFTNFSSVRPRSADSSLPRPPLLPLTVPPLFSSTHRVTAAGSITHLSQAEVDALDLQSLTSSERVVHSRAPDVSGAGRERVILLEPLVITAKVDTGLRGEEAAPKESEEDTESQQQQPQSEDPEERRRRRRERTEQRRRRGRQQREERNALLATQLAEEEKEQLEEKIEAEPNRRPVPAAPAPPPLSPASQARLQRAELERYHQQADLYDSLLPSTTSLSPLTSDPSPALVSAVIQAHVIDHILAPHHEPSDLSTGPHPPIPHATQARRRETHWLEKRNRTRPQLGTQIGKHSADEVLLWSERHPPLHEEGKGEEEEVRAWMSCMAHEPLDYSSTSSSSSSSPSSPSSPSHAPALSPTTTLPIPLTTRSDIPSAPSERTSYTLQRLGDASQPSTSRPSTSRPSTSHTNRPPSSSSSSRTSTAAEGGRQRARGGPPQASVGGRKERRGKRMGKDGGRPAQVAAKGERGRRSVVYDQRVVGLEGGGEMGREAVLLHHARDVQVVVDALIDAVGVGLINLPAPISLLTVPDRGMGGAAPAPPSSLTSPQPPTLTSPSAAKHARTSLLTTVMHGKDMMIVLNWLTHLARAYITHVLSMPGYSTDPPSSSPSLPSNPSPPIDDPPPSLSEAGGPLPTSPESSKRLLPPLELLGLDRRTLYTAGMTHEGIDQVYSGVYAYSVGFFHLLEGLVLPALSPSSDMSGAALMHRLWCGYKRLLELSQPALYDWMLQCTQCVGKEEADAVWAAHVREVERSAAMVRGRREEVRGLKAELAQMDEAYEDTLDGVSEARVTVMSLREANYREERQLAEISDDSIAEMTAKASRASAQLQVVEDDSVRVREKRAMTVKAIVQARADLHLARLHSEDMRRLIGERSVISAVLETQYTPASAKVKAAEAEASEKAAVSLTLSLQSYQQLHYNQQLRLTTDAQLAWLTLTQKRGLLSHITEPWLEVKADLCQAFDVAQAAFTAHVQRELALEGVSLDSLEAEVKRMQDTAEPMTTELKAKLGLTLFEQERNRRVGAAQSSHASSSTALAALTSHLAQLTSELAVVHSSYTRVYTEKDAILQSNAGLQASIDTHLDRLATLAPQQSTTRVSIASTRSEIDDFIAQCQQLPRRIDALRVSIAALVPRQAELDSVEVAKGAVHRSLLLEKEKLDAEYARAVRDGDEMKGEMEELERQLGEMEEKAAPLWRELDGKMGVLEREMDYKKREWENHHMRLAEEEQRSQWRMDLVAASVEKLKPRQEQLREAQSEADAVRALLLAEQAVHESIRLELRDVREQMQAQTKEKEEFLATHIADAHALQERKAQAMGHIAHLRDVLEHTRSELRASYAVNEQMLLGFDKRLQQWRHQLEGKKDANRKKADIDAQRKEVQLVKRTELADAIAVVHHEWQVEDERRRELQERLWMMQEEVQAEQQRSADMQREKERLERFHADLTVAAPHLRRELDRVSEKDRDFDVQQVEAAIAVELEKQAQLMRRVAVLEEEQWQRHTRRCERWMQTEPSRHFKRVRAEDVHQRFVLGQELGLITDGWMKEKQRDMRDKELQQEERGSATSASRSRQPSVVVLHPSAAVLQRTIEQSRMSVSGSDDGSEEGLWEASLRSSTHSRAVSSTPPVPRRRAGSQTTGQALHQRAPSSVDSRPAGRSGKATHARTQSSMPAPSWHLHRAPAPDTRDRRASRREAVEEEEGDAVDEQKQQQGASPPTAWRSTREERVHSLHGSSAQHSRQVSRPSLPSQRRSLLPRSPSPHPSSPQSSVGSSFSTRSPLSPSRPLTPDDSPTPDRIAPWDTAAGDGAYIADRHRSRSRTLSRSPSPQQPPSASGAMPVLNRLLSTKRTPSSHSRTIRASSPSPLDSSPTPPPLPHRSSSPSPSFVMDPATLIPHNALRPTSPSPHRLPAPQSRHPAPSPPPPPPPSTISAPALEQLYEATARTFDVGVAGGRRLTREVVAEELDAKAAREEEMAYERYLQEQLGGVKKGEGGVAEEGGGERAGVDVRVKLSPAAEATDALGNPRHRGAVQLAASPVAGTLTEWLELQVRSAMGVEEEDRRRRQAASLSGPLPHGHLSLMMPDPLEQKGAVRVEQAPAVQETAPESSLAATEVAEVKVEGVAETDEEVVEMRRVVQTRRVVQFVDAEEVVAVEAPVDEVGPLVSPLVSPLTGKVYVRRARVNVVVPPEARGVGVRVVTPQAKTERKEKERFTHDDEQPGRLPNYVKRSIRAMYAQQQHK